MLLVMDIGNTCVTLGVYADDTLALTARLATDRNRTEDQYAVELHTLLTMRGLDVNDFDGAIIGSVVPALTGVMEKALQTAVGVRPLVVGKGLKTGLPIHLEDPAAAGAGLRTKLYHPVGMREHLRVVVYKQH